jgi:putative flavoprotein involved in K+ transport
MCGRRAFISGATSYGGWTHSASWTRAIYTEVEDLGRAWGVPSPQLIGTTERASIDLNGLREAGVELVGRLAAVRDGKAQFSGSRANLCALADLKTNRMLASMDS